MVILNKIYTKTGDKGSTSLGDGSRVSKDSLRVETYGTIDEANSIIGIVRTHTKTSELITLDNFLGSIQNELFDLGAELSTPQKSDHNSLSIVEKQVDRIEQEIDQLNKNHQNFKTEIEANQKKYEQLIDEAADEISNFVEKAKLENVSQ